METDDTGEIQLNISTESSFNQNRIPSRTSNESLSGEQGYLKGKNVQANRDVSSEDESHERGEPKRVFQNKAGKSGPGERSGKARHISSLFYSNPEIPHITECDKKGKEEILFTDRSFSDFDLHPHLVSCLESRLSITKMTEVQRKAIPELLDGKDVLVKSCTGSGKTLAYAIPIIQSLQAMNPKIQRADGAYALVILPTRELALQSYECFSKLAYAFTWIVPGYLIGGEKKKSEKARIRKGINILVSTPGRLLDHLDHTANLSFEKVQWLVIDEADRLAEEGFEDAAMKIVSRVKQDMKSSKLQTVLLSATLSRGVEKLAGMSLKDPVCIDIASADGSSEEMMDLVLPAQLKQFVVVVPTKLRLVTLSAFLVDKCSKGKMKALIFFCTQSSVDFHFHLFNFALKTMLKLKGYKTKFFKLHGSMKQEDRTEIFEQFKSAPNGILLSTDLAARGLDLSEVDWIVQYNAPISVQDYVHKVGRTARIGKKGDSLLFLIPSEIKFCDLLQRHQIYLEEMDMNEILNSLLVIADVIQETSKQRFRKKTIEEHASSLQMKYEDIVYSDEDCHASAKEAFLSFLKAYSSYPKSMKTEIPFKLLHLGHVAKSFCLRESPSELGCHSSRSAPSRKQVRPGKQAREIKKRKSAMISEYDSGLSKLNEEESNSQTKRFKRKLSAISEYDSGLKELNEESNLQTKKFKKRKLAMISEYDSGL